MNSAFSTIRLQMSPITSIVHCRLKPACLFAPIDTSSLFFFRKEDECHTKFVPETLRVLGVTKHLVHRRDTSFCSWVTSTFQQRSCERFSLPKKTTDCSTICNARHGRSIGGFGADFALCCAKHCPKVCVSLGHFPPTSLARNTILALLLLPHSSGLSAFRLRACFRAFPLVVSAFFSGVPSLWFADTNVASRASCTPPKRDKPSAITSNLRIRLLLRSVQVSQPWPRLCDKSGRQHSQNDVSCWAPALGRSVMAKDVKRTATRTETAGEGNGKPSQRSNNTLNDCELCCEGTDAIGPLWDRTDACSDGDNGKNHFHQNHFHQKNSFIKIHFHQKTTLIKKPLSSKNHFHQNPIS